jgi:hypothetical protein
MVQAFWSSQGRFDWGTYVHIPVPKSHASAVQSFPSSHRALNPTQVPATHASSTVQISPSLQGSPSFSGGYSQPAVGEQAFAVQPL